MISTHSKVVITKKGNKRMTTYYIRGSTVWLSYYVDGKRVQRSTKLKNTPKNIKIVEKQIIPKINIKIATGEIYKKKPKTFEHYGEIFLRQKSHYKSYFSKVSKWRKVIEFFKNQNIDKITRLEIKEYLSSLNIKSTSKDAYKNCINEVFELAVDDGVLVNNPATNIKLPRDERRVIDYYSKEEVNSLINSASGFFKVYLQIGFNTGLRSGEILGLQIGDFSNGYIHIKRARSKGVIGTGKNRNAQRKVPFPAFLLDEIKKIQTNNIFIFGDIDDAGKLDYVWRNTVKLANVKKLKLYSTRHTYATLMLQKKIVSINELAGLLGHSSAKTTLDRYASVIDTEIVNLDSNFSLFCDNTVTLESETRFKPL